MRRALVLGLALALAGCQNDSTAPSVSLQGSYSLRTINGTSLPYTFSNGLTLAGEVVTLYGDGTYTDVSTYLNGQSSSDQGFYTNNNGAITFTDQTAGIQFQGSLSGSVLTEIVGGFTQAFSKN
jgi:hypothetical protein